MFDPIIEIAIKIQLIDIFWARAFAGSSLPHLPTCSPLTLNLSPGKAAPRVRTISDVDYSGVGTQPKANRQEQSDTTLTQQER